MRMDDVLVCLNTCPGRDSAERIADALVEERLAACVNIVPGLRSTYRWQGRIERDEECLLIIKTRSACLAALRTRLVALHPYELPELIAVKAADGLPAYLDWVRNETGVS
ncbi:divalent-cation tolerance protein CutA [Luteimonas sp. e5]